MLSLVLISWSIFKYLNSIEFSLKKNKTMLLSINSYGNSFSIIRIHHNLQSRVDMVTATCEEKNTYGLIYL